MSRRALLGSSLWSPWRQIPLEHCCQQPRHSAGSEAEGSERNCLISSGHACRDISGHQLSAGAVTGPGECSEHRSPNYAKPVLGVSLVLAACGFGPLSAVGACLAWFGRARLALSLRARRWANAGLLLGTVNSALWCATWIWIEAHPATTPESPTAITERSGFGAMAALPHFPLHPELEVLGETSSSSAATDGVRAARQAHVGRLLVIDVDPEVSSLSAFLEEVAGKAAHDGKIPLLWLSSRDCEPCSVLVEEMRSTRLQRVLTTSILIRVDVEEFASELEDLRLPRDRLPAFGLLDGQGRPTDFVDSGEWPNERASAIAPILRALLHGELRERRFPWRGGERAHTIPI